jgi:hypothetical protein
MVRIRRVDVRGSCGIATRNHSQSTLDGRRKKKLRLAAMIRTGALCRSCTVKVCRDLSTDREPIDIECPACHGAGCEDCRDGKIRIDGCPNRQCQDMYSFIQLSDLFSKGILPTAGGALDQSASFIEAVQFFESDQAKVRAELNGN